MCVLVSGRAALCGRLDELLPLDATALMMTMIVGSIGRHVSPSGEGRQCRYPNRNTFFVSWYQTAFNYM